MFPYAVSVLHHAVSAILNLPGKMATERVPVQQSWSWEKISREAMDSTLCKLSMIVRIAKAASNKHPWV